MGEGGAVEATPRPLRPCTLLAGCKRAALTEVMRPHNDSKPRGRLLYMYITCVCEYVTLVSRCVYERACVRVAHLPLCVYGSLGSFENKTCPPKGQKPDDTPTPTAPASTTTQTHAHDAFKGTHHTSTMRHASGRPSTEPSTTRGWVWGAQTRFQPHAVQGSVHSGRGSAAAATTLHAPAMYI